MKTRWTLFIGFLLTIFVAGCSSSTEENAVKLIDQGYIVDIDKSGQRLLVTEKLDGNEGQHGNAAWLTVDEDTSISDPDENKITFDDLRTGWMVEVWNKGAVAESYPVQAQATKINVKTNGDESIAISKALGYLQGEELKFIQNADYDQQQQIWTIKIVELGSSHILLVNLENDEVTEQDKQPDSQRGSEPEPAEKDEATPTPSNPDIVAENEAFRIFEPEPNVVVDKTLKVRGEARVFEAVLSYSLEDGHEILAEGHVQASKGAPEWGSFEIDITLKQMPTSPSGMLTIYEGSAKDGSPIHQLHIPLKFKEFR